MKIHLRFICVIVLLSFVSPGLVFADRDSSKQKRWTINDLLVEKIRPYAIGHRGYGVNLGEDPNKPIENTVASVKRAFEEGVSIVEVDVVMTADRKAVALHDDYLSDLTCVNSLSYDELRERLPYVPTLKKVLQAAKKFSRRSKKDSGNISGLVNIEVKTPSPLCDPLDQTEAELVYSVLRAIKIAKSNEQVIIETFSPALMNMFYAEAPDIVRNLPSTILQFLTPEQIEAVTGLPVTLIDKNAGFGLNWAEIGAWVRLPGYSSIDEYVSVAIGTSATLATLDVLMVMQMEQASPGSAAMLVQQLHMLGFVVTTYTVNTESEWLFLKSIGIDAIYTDNIPMGVEMEQGEL